MATFINKIKKERVNMKLRNNIERKAHIDKIYQADEATRRAIDTLYTGKSDHRKMVAVYAVITLFIGVVIGVTVGTGVISTAQAKSATVELKMADDHLKAQPQQNQ